jgi:hypothetical protein
VSWLVLPSLRTAGFQLLYSDAIAVLALGAVWLAAWKRVAGRSVYRATAVHE